MPGLDDVLAAHLAHLRLLGRSERTVYDRERAVIRLAAWLRARKEVMPSDPYPGQRVTGAGDSPSSPALLQATADDLGAWRASLTVGDQAVVVYSAHVAGCYVIAFTQGIRPDNADAVLPVPSPP